MNRKAPTPIRSTPSSAPLEAMVAKQQAHIDELVMQNRTSEQIILKLKAEIDIGKHRHDNNLQQIKQQFEQERAEWKQAGDSLQNLWRIAYLRIVTALEKEKADGLKTKEELRLARLARLQRDYQIGMFQAKELESENQIVDLQDHLEDAQWSHEQERLKRVELKIQLQESLGELHEMRSERSQLEKSLTGLRSEHTALIASSHASSSSLERVHLQVEGLESSLAELQEKYAEEERNNSDLLRQLEKYRNLEKQEYEESNNLRKQNIELDTEVQNLKEQVEQYTTLIEERENKYHKRMQEYKESLKEHGDAIKDRDDELEQKDTEIANLKQRLVDIAEEVKVLGAQLDNERTKTQVVPKQTKKAEPAGSKTASKPFNETPSSRPKPRPVTGIKKPKITDEGSDESEIEQQITTKKMPASARPEEDSEIEEVEQPVAKKSKKASAPESSQAKAAPKKARKRRSPTPDVEFVDERSEPVPRPGKRKAAVVDIEDDEPTQKKAKKASMKDKAAPKAKKAPPKGKSREVIPTDSESEEVEPVHKKKKRKINIGNIFPSAQASTFDWGTLPQGDGSLNIPTQLSPVKEALLAPSRAGGSGSTGRTFGSIGRR